MILVLTNDVVKVVSLVILWSNLVYYVLKLKLIFALAYSERRAAKKEPVLLKDQYVTEVLNVMNQKHSVTFRDQAELHQATQFLHDNGVLLHYDDISLKVGRGMTWRWKSQSLKVIISLTWVKTIKLPQSIVGGLSNIVPKGRSYQSLQ